MLELMRCKGQLLVIDMRSVQCFTRQEFDGGGCGSERWRGHGRSIVRVAVIVVLEILEDVTDVQESVAVEANFNERGLHAGEDASDFTFVDAADEGELFFALDVNFD